METEPRFKVSFDRLEKPGIEPATPVLQGKWFIHYTTAAPKKLDYKLKKIVGSNNFSAQFIKIISHYKKIGYNINVLQQTACLVVNPITVGNFAFLFNCTLVGRTSDSMMVPT